MILAEAVFNIDESVLRTLAWIFTVLSAVVSIGLSIHRFGLSPGKRIVAIVGVLAFGVTIAILFISEWSPFRQFVFISNDQAEQIKVAHDKEGDRSSGYEVTEDGVTEKTAESELNRVSEFIYAVIHPDGKITAVYNGGFFDAEINGQVVNCELIEIGDDRVLIIKGEELETIDLKSDQAETTFKVQRVPVKPLH